jgi:hypothetical protein
MRKTNLPKTAVAERALTKKIREAPVWYFPIFLFQFGVTDFYPM